MIISPSSSHSEVGRRDSACESKCHLAIEQSGGGDVVQRVKWGRCLVSVMQDGNEFATVCCSQAILERLTSENAGPSRKIRSHTRGKAELSNWEGGAS